jgi:hypothetical protein
MQVSILKENEGQIIFHGIDKSTVDSLFRNPIWEETTWKEGVTGQVVAAECAQFTIGKINIVFFAEGGKHKAVKKLIKRTEEL